MTRHLQSSSTSIPFTVFLITEKTCKLWKTEDFFKRSVDQLDDLSYQANARELDLNCVAGFLHSGNIHIRIYKVMPSIKPGQLWQCWLVNLPVTRMFCSKQNVIQLKSESIRIETILNRRKDTEQWSSWSGSQPSCTLQFDIDDMQETKWLLPIHVCLKTWTWSYHLRDWFVSVSTHCSALKSGRKGLNRR